MKQEVLAKNNQYMYQRRNIEMSYRLENTYFFCLPKLRFICLYITSIYEFFYHFPTFVQRNRASRPRQYSFLISARIVLYRHRKSGHHLGTKASKIIAFISALIVEKACICKDFYSSILSDSTKSNTIFYNLIYPILIV